MTTSPLCPGDCRACFYCETPLAPRHEHDHFPLPARAGGGDTVPTCLNCHDFKDRVPLDGWPVELVMQAFNEAGPMGRILIAKSAAIYANFRADRAEEAA